ncbi:hypothetical protein GCM10027597_50270 [Saccharopolyspora tripterygii]
MDGNATLASDILFLPDSSGERHDSTSAFRLSAGRYGLDETDARDAGHSL